jgi:hypothetical protein
MGLSAFIEEYIAPIINENDKLKHQCSKCKSYDDVVHYITKENKLYYEILNCEKHDKYWICNNCFNNSDIQLNIKNMSDSNIECGHCCKTCFICCDIREFTNIRDDETDSFYNESRCICNHCLYDTYLYHCHNCDKCIYKSDKLILCNSCGSIKCECSISFICYKCKKTICGTNQNCHKYEDKNKCGKFNCYYCRDKSIDSRHYID